MLYRRGEHYRAILRHCVKCEMLLRSGRIDPYVVPQGICVRSRGHRPISHLPLPKTRVPGLGGFTIYLLIVSTIVGN